MRLMRVICVSGWYMNIGRYNEVCVKKYYDRAIDYWRKKNHDSPIVKAASDRTRTSELLFCLGRKNELCLCYWSLQGLEWSITQVHAMYVHTKQNQPQSTFWQQNSSSKMSHHTFWPWIICIPGRKFME